MNLRIIACIAFALLCYVASPETDALRWGLTIFGFAGALWMTQALPLSVTALLIPVLAAVSGVMSFPQALASFANPIIFLFLGGFALAAALKEQGLDQAMASIVLRLARGHLLRAVLYLFGMTAFMSMWISNTAAVVIMLPLAMGLISANKALRLQDKAFILLGIAYSGSIGGIGSLIGSPPNAIAAAQVGISFVGWMKFGIPLVLVLLPTMLGVLYLCLKPSIQGRMAVSDEKLIWTAGRVSTVSVFVLTACGWIYGPFFAESLGLLGQTDAIVAISAVVLLTLTGAIQWQAIESHCEWGILLLFGGGLALSRVMDVSGGSSYLANALANSMHQTPTIFLTLALVTFVVFVTELVSNTASAALLIPIFTSLASALGMDPQLLAVAIAVSASCAFMLPVATPPNAIIFSTGVIPQSMMMRTGFLLNLFCIVIIVGFVSIR